MPTRSSDETVERMRAILHETFELVGSQAAHAQHTKDYAAWFIRHLDDMSITVSALAVVEGVPRDEAVAKLRDILREVELRVAREPGLLTRVEGRAGLMQNWGQVLLDAAAKVERDRRDEELYAAYGESEEDRAYEQSIAALAAEGWRDE